MNFLLGNIHGERQRRGNPIAQPIGLGAGDKKFCGLKGRDMAALQAASSFCANTQAVGLGYGIAAPSALKN